MGTKIAIINMKTVGKWEQDIEYKMEDQSNVRRSAYQLVTPPVWSIWSLSPVSQSLPNRLLLA